MGYGMMVGSCTHTGFFMLLAGLVLQTHEDLAERFQVGRQTEGGSGQGGGVSAHDRGMVLQMHEDLAERFQVGEGSGVLVLKGLERVDTMERHDAADARRPAGGGPAAGGGLECWCGGRRCGFTR